MLKDKLDFCASLLYHWIKLHSETNQAVTFSLENFQIWTSEFLLHEASREEIQAALSELQNFDLITIKDSKITLRDRINKIQPQIESLPTYHLTFSKNHYPGLGAFIIALCFVGFGLGSMFLPNNNNMTQQNRENIEKIAH